MLNYFLVIHESFKVVHVALEFVLGHILVGFKILKPLTTEVNVPAFISGAVFFPIYKAQPAKLMLTLSTRHMVASLIFLDWFVTGWAGFCEGFNPVHVLTFGLSLLFPLKQDKALSWGVCLTSTAHTNSLSTLALVGGLVVKGYLLEEVAAARLRAPPYARIRVSKLARHPLPVLIGQCGISFKKLQKKAMRHFEIATRLHTISYSWVIWVFHLRLHVFFPAVLAKGMPARKCQFVSTQFFVAN